MADFGISFSRLTNGNIRHIYSVSSKPAFIPAPRPHGRTSQFVSLTLEDRYPPKFYDYYPAYQVGLPRAPAFDRLTAPEMRELVKRLRRPIACQLQCAQKFQSSGPEEVPRAKEKGQSKVVRWMNPSAMMVKVRDAEETPETKAADRTTGSETDEKSKVETIDSEEETEVKVNDDRQQMAPKPNEESEKRQATEVKMRPKTKSDSNLKRDKKGKRPKTKLPLIYLAPSKQFKGSHKPRADKPEDRFTLPPIYY